MTNLTHNEPRKAGPGRLLMSVATVSAVVVGAAGIVAAQGQAAPPDHDGPTPGPLYERFQHPQLKHGVLTIAGTTFNVTQTALTCTPEVSPTTQLFSSAPNYGGSTVTAAAGCTWTAVSNTQWITVTSGASGSGNGSVVFNVATNNSSNDRTGSLTIAGTTFTVSQLASNATCTASISPVSQSFTSSAGAGSVSVTAPTGCVWIALSGVPWITMTGSVGSPTARREIFRAASR